ncbi:ribosome-associated translation inhibitor RaiA [Candidatus Woesebacteria bacterium]|nr:MAG: ribosome-associated translation inhibitor RaiA [Candidatus Woesebacteria bacterium]
MKLQISASGVPLAGTVQSEIEKKLGEDLERPLKHFPEDVKNAVVHVSKESRFGYKITFEMKLPGTKIFSEESDADFFVALTKLREEVKRQILRHKDKITSKQ